MKNVLKTAAALSAFFIANMMHAQINVGATLGGTVSSGVNTARVGSVINNATSNVVNRAATTTRNEANKVKSFTENASEKANATIRENSRKNTDISASNQTSANGQVNANSGASVEVRTNNSTAVHQEHTPSDASVQHSSGVNASVSDATLKEQATTASNQTKARIKATQETATRSARKLTDQAKSIQPSANVETQVSGSVKARR